MQGKTERCNRTIIAPLWHYVNEHQSKRDEFILPLTYPYNLQPYRSTDITDFALVLSPEASRALSSNSLDVADTSGRNVPASILKLDVLYWVRTMSTQVPNSTRVVQTIYKLYFDRRVQSTLSQQANGLEQVYFLDPRLRPTSRLSNESDQLANGNSYKFVLKKRGPYMFFSS